MYDAVSLLMSFFGTPPPTLQAICTSEIYRHALTDAYLDFRTLQIRLLEMIREAGGVPVNKQVSITLQLSFNSKYQYPGPPVRFPLAEDVLGVKQASDYGIDWEKTVHSWFRDEGVEAYFERWIDTRKTPGKTWQESLQAASLISYPFEDAIYLNDQSVAYDPGHSSRSKLPDRPGTVLSASYEATLAITPCLDVPAVRIGKVPGKGLHYVVGLNSYGDEGYFGKE